MIWLIFYLICALCAFVCAASFVVWAATGLAIVILDFLEKLLR